MLQTTRMITLPLPTLVAAAFTLVTSTATATFTVTKLIYERRDAAAPVGTRGAVGRITRQRPDVLFTGGLMAPVRLSRTVPPTDIGSFQPAARKCSMDVNTGAVTLAIHDRTPGTFAGCCVPLSRPVNLYPGTIAQFDFSLAKDDRLDVKFEGGLIGSDDRTTALLIDHEPIRKTESTVTRTLTSDGHMPLRETISDATRVCFAIVGEDGPSSNSLTISSVSLN